jgi:protease I
MEVPMAAKLKGRRVAILAADMVEQVELEEPRQALGEAGATTEVISLHGGEIQAFNHFEPSESVQVDREVGGADPDEYDALYIPGGVGNPDQLRGDDDAVEFVRRFYQSGKPIGATCHGPWVLIEAGLASGHNLASWPTLRTDILNAGGEWVDREVVEDGQLITSRGPDDLPAYCDALVEHVANGAR